MEITPALNVFSKEELDERIALIETHFETAQIDVSDGIFVNTKSYDVVGEIEKTELIFGVHLMVSKPENHIARWLTLPNINEICFHVESTAKHQEVISAVRESDVSLGIALNPDTPWKDIEPWINLVDFVQFLTVSPGPNGNPFVSAVVDKITDFHFYYPDKAITVDGGVTPDKIEQLENAGVTRCIVGSAITKFIHV